MEFVHTAIPDVILIKPQFIRDERGFFLETFRARLFSQAGIIEPFVQDNHSGSYLGTLRGLHYQIHQAQGKLIRTIVGEVYDVAVDIRRSSPNFGKWVGVYLSETNQHQLWIPKGFAHGFLVLSKWAEVIYKVTDYYSPIWERCIAWDDPTINIEWPLKDAFPLILSNKDKRGKQLTMADLYK